MGTCIPRRKQLCFYLILIGIKEVADAYQQDENDLKTTKLVKRLTDPDFMDADNRPHVSGPPTTVKLGFFLLSLGEIDELHMDFTMDLFFRVQWTDPRLVFDEIDEDLVINSKVISKFWTPDVYFPNVKKANFHEVTVPNRQLVITPQGNCTYNLRITAAAACPMDLSKFPMDTQRCSLKMESYSHSTRHILLEWIEGNPIVLAEDLELPEMEIIDISQTRCDTVYATGDTYSCLKVTFVLRRRYGFFILQTFVPSILIVILSWMSFWIHIEAAPARISLGVTTVLTMATQMSGSKDNIPQISYPKAIDIWTSACMMFVFTALLEYAVVNSLMRKEPKTKGNQQRIGEDGQYELTPGSGGYASLKNNHQAANNIDRISRVSFPFCFSVFNVIFWSIYLS